MKLVQKCLLGGVTALFAGFVLMGSQSDQPIKDDVKDAGNATKRAAKKSTKKVKHESKKAANKAASKTEEGAAKVEEKTRP